jgi:polyhydroxybutyrate depolymerase
MHPHQLDRPALKKPEPHTLPLKSVSSLACRKIWLAAGFLLLGWLPIEGAVPSPPTISIQPRAKTYANEGSSVLLSVTVADEEDEEGVAFQWHHNGQVIPEANDRVLRLTRVGLDHVGEYWVRVSNSAGAVESRAAAVAVYVTLPVPFDPALRIQAGPSLRLSWRGGGVLQSAPTPEGPWTRVTTTSSEHAVNAGKETEFYRLQSQTSRNVRVFVPSSYRPGVPAPFVMVLHGYGQAASGMEDYLSLRQHAEAEGFLYCTPQGTSNNVGWTFWNAWGACCNYYSSTVDDVSYLRTILLKSIAELGADPKRIHVTGLSNGGFMALRMAMEAPELIASVASIAGTMDRETQLPPPGEPVSILQIHGTSDQVIFFPGGRPTSGLPGLTAATPEAAGAREVVERWQEWNRCLEAEEESEPSLDLDSGLRGNDSQVSRWKSCTDDVAVELWTIVNGGHVPSLNLQSSGRILRWLLAHPKK